jgi:hypothetical protein
MCTRDKRINEMSRSGAGIPCGKASYSKDADNIVDCEDANTKSFDCIKYFRRNWFAYFTVRTEIFMVFTCRTSTCAGFISRDG